MTICVWCYSEKFKLNVAEQKSVLAFNLLIHNELSGNTCSRLGL